MTSLDTSDITQEALEASESNVILSLRQSVVDEVKSLQDKIALIDFVLTKRMEADGATALPSEHYKVELGPASAQKYDDSKLYAVNEYVNMMELIKVGAFTPAHGKQVDIPASFNLTKLKPFIKFNAAIGDIIEGAKIPSAQVLKVTKK